MIIYTIGHSNVDVEAVTELLKAHDIDVVLDVRTSPYSEHAPQFDRETLAEQLAHAGIEYVHGGNYLGGKPRDRSCYDQHDEEKVLYQEVEKRDWYQQGIDGLIELAMEKWTAVMCAEEDPSQCHRHLLIAQTLLDREVEVQHIRHKGGETWTEPAQRTLDREVEQLGFGDEWA